MGVFPAACADEEYPGNISLRVGHLRCLEFPGQDQRPSIAHTFNLFKEVHVRLVGDTAPPHHLAQILRLDKPAGLPKGSSSMGGIVLWGHRRSGMDTPLGTNGLAGSTVSVELTLLLGIVHAFMSNKQPRHDALSPCPHQTEFFELVGYF